MTASEAGTGLVYHYTDQVGLLGILTPATGTVYLTGEPVVEIRATHVGYLNDSKEFKLAISQVLEIARSKVEHAPAAQMLVDLLKGEWSDATSADGYVASFSHHADSLAQWRAYGGQSTGYAIGVPSKVLGGIAEWAYAGDCLYDPKVQQQALEELVEKLLRSGDLGGMQTGARLNLAKQAAFIKHPGFKEEGEYRLYITGRQHFGPGHSEEYRPGKSTIVPYKKWPIRKNDVKEVWVGPSASQPAACVAVERMLKERGFENVVVKKSSTPYRSW